MPSGADFDSARVFYHFDVFEDAGAGSYFRRTENDSIAGALYGDLFSNGGIVDLAERMPELARRTNSMAIDVVYTWVNSKDPEWIRAFESAERGHAGTDAVSHGRFHANDDLRYSLRSVDMNLPWVGTIYIVSNCRPPGMARHGASTHPLGAS